MITCALLRLVLAEKLIWPAWKCGANGDETGRVRISKPRNARRTRGASIHSLVHSSGACLAGLLACWLARSGRLTGFARRALCTRLCLQARFCAFGFVVVAMNIAGRSSASFLLNGTYWRIYASACCVLIEGVAFCSGSGIVEHWRALHAEMDCTAELQR